jgi:hypothetical protein
LPLIDDTVIEVAPVRAVPPALISVYEVADALGVAHFNPVASAESAVRTVAFAPTPRRATVDAAVALIRSPFVVNSVG